MKSNKRGQASIMTREQIKALYNNASPDLRLFLQIFRYTGERPQAVLSLEQNICYHEDGTVKDRLLFKGITRKQAAGKPAKDRVVLVREELKKELDCYDRPNSIYMFASPRNLSKPLTYHGLRYRFEKLLEKCGFQHHNFSLYSYRRTVADKLSRQALTPKELMDAMGWKSYSSAIPYMEVNREVVDNAMRSLD